MGVLCGFFGLLLVVYAVVALLCWALRHALRFVSSGLIVGWLFVCWVFGWVCGVGLLVCGYYVLCLIWICFCVVGDVDWLIVLLWTQLN